MQCLRLHVFTPFAGHPPRIASSTHIRVSSHGRSLSRWILLLDRRTPDTSSPTPHAFSWRRISRRSRSFGSSDTARAVQWSKARKVIRILQSGASCPSPVHARLLRLEKTPQPFVSPGSADCDEAFFTLWSCESLLFHCMDWARARAGATNLSGYNGSPGAKSRDCSDFWAGRFASPRSTPALGRCQRRPFGEQTRACRCAPCIPFPLR